MSSCDGSLLRRKKEQWAREREELKKEASDFWDRFGSPGGGSPNRVISASKSKKECANERAECREYSSENETSFVSRIETVHDSQIERTSDSSEVWPSRAGSESNEPIAPPCPAELYMRQNHLYPSTYPVPMHMMPYGLIPVPMPVIGPTNMESSTIAHATDIYNPMMWMPQYGYQQVDKSVNGPHVLAQSSQITSIHEYNPTSALPLSGRVMAQEAKPAAVSHESSEFQRGLSFEKCSRASVDSCDTIDCGRVPSLATAEPDDSVGQQQQRACAMSRAESIDKQADRRIAETMASIKKAQEEAELVRKMALYRHARNSEAVQERLERTLGVDDERSNAIFEELDRCERHKRNDASLCPTVDKKAQKAANKTHANGTAAVMTNSGEKKQTTVVAKRRARASSDMGMTFTSFNNDENSHYTDSTSTQNPLFCRVSTRRSQRMRTTSDMEKAAHATASNAVPSIEVSFEDVRSPPHNNNEVKISRPSYYPNSYLTSRDNKESTFSRKLAEKGCTTPRQEDILSPHLRQEAESNLSRSPSVQSLRGSMNSLHLRGESYTPTSHENSPTLGRFRSTQPAYRSFSTKKTSEKQQEILERLNKLRAQLRSRDNFERGTYETAATHS